MTPSWFAIILFLLPVAALILTFVLVKRRSFLLRAARRRPGWIAKICALAGLIILVVPGVYSLNRAHVLYEADPGAETLLVKQPAKDSVRTETPDPDQVEFQLTLLLSGVDHSDVPAYAETLFFRHSDIGRRFEKEIPFHGESILLAWEIKQVSFRSHLRDSVPFLRAQVEGSVHLTSKQKWNRLFWGSNFTSGAIVDGDGTIRYLGGLFVYGRNPLSYLPFVDRRWEAELIVAAASEFGAKTEVPAETYLHKLERAGHPPPGGISGFSYAHHPAGKGSQPPAGIRFLLFTAPAILFLLAGSSFLAIIFTPRFRVMAFTGAVFAGTLYVAALDRHTLDLHLQQMSRPEASHELRKMAAAQANLTFFWKDTAHDAFKVVADDPDQPAQLREFCRQLALSQANM